MPNAFLLAAETAGSEAPTLLHTLATLLAIIVVARIAAELAERVGIPTVLAEIGAGILLGGSVLGLVESTETLHVLAEIGAILLLFEVGLHMDLGDLMRVGANASRVALIGIVAPAAATYPIAIALGIERNGAIFLAAAVTATSVGITARVFAEMKVLSTPAARTVLGAAVIDDILGLLILTFVTQSLGDTEGGRSIEMTIVFALGFLLIGGAIAIIMAPKYFNLVHRFGRTDGSLTVGTFGFALAVAAAGAWAGLAPLVGAFLAGVAAARSDRSADFQRKVAPLGQVIIPIFFVAVGLEVDVAAFFKPGALVLALTISVIAIITKLVSGFGVLGGKSDRILVGMGMIPRGEVGLIFATLGLSSGVLDTETHATLVLVVLITTIVTPPMLRWRVARQAKSVQESAPSDTGVPSAECLKEDGATIELETAPAQDEALLVTLLAARALADRRPGPKLMEWLRNTPFEKPAWDDDSRAALFDLLEHGRDRSFRLLESTGMFGRMFPSIASEPAHSIDPYGLDPETDATWDGVLALQALLQDPIDPAADAYMQMPKRQNVALAALARGAFEAGDAGAKAKKLASDIGLGLQDAEEVGELVAERRLLPAAALEPDLGREEAILELATHLESRRRATGLYVLAVAENRQDREIRARLDELYGLLRTALTEQEGGGDLLEGRRAAIRREASDLPSELVADHLEEAPRRYLLAYSPETVALHMRMLDPMPKPLDVRINIETEEKSRSRVHIVVRDRLGAMAALANAINESGHSIHDASAAVWPTRIAILVFLIDTAAPINAADLEPDLVEALRIAETIPAFGEVDGDLSFDNHASPWYSIIEVRGPSGEGMLAKVASAISSVGGEIVYANVTTNEGLSLERFFVVGRSGEKLSSRDERNLRAAFQGKRPSRIAGGR